MCNKCFALAGDVDSLKSLPCPRALDFNEPLKKEVDERREDKSWVTWTDWEKEKKEWEQKKKLSHEMNQTRRELQRLQLLKQLQVERERMAELIAQKRNGASFLSKHAMFNCEKKHDYMYYYSTTISLRSVCQFFYTCIRFLQVQMFWTPFLCMNRNLLTWHQLRRCLCHTDVYSQRSIKPNAVHYICVYVRSRSFLCFWV